MTKLRIKIIWRRPSKLHTHKAVLQIQIPFPSAYFLRTKKKKNPTAQGMRSTTKLHNHHGSLVTSSGTRGIYLLCKVLSAPRLRLSVAAITSMRHCGEGTSFVTQCDRLQRGKRLISFLFLQSLFVSRTGREHVVWP